MLLRALDAVDEFDGVLALAGKRVLITGVEGALGVDMACGMAEQRTRLVLVANDDGPESDATAELAVQNALEVRLFTGPFPENEHKLRLVRATMQCFGGIDCVINLARIGAPSPDADAAAVERQVTDCLALPVLATKIAANRMRMMKIAGSIVNVVTVDRGAPAAAHLVGTIARSSLAAFTRGEARSAAEDGIRINAIVPSGTGPGERGGLTTIPDLVTLALKLSSDCDSSLSGLAYEAYCG